MGVTVLLGSSADVAMLCWDSTGLGLYNKQIPGPDYTAASMLAPKVS